MKDLEVAFLVLTVKLVYTITADTVVIDQSTAPFYWNTGFDVFFRYDLAVFYTYKTKLIGAGLGSTSFGPG